MGRSVGISMSKKHIEEQKLLIENFNKWINEEKCGEKEIEETAESIEEEEEDDLNEAIFTLATLATVGKLVTSLHKLLGAYNEFTKITDEMMQDPNTSDAVKQIATDVQQAGSDITDASGPIAKDLPIGQKLTNKAINHLIKKHFNIDANIDVSKLKLPTSSDSEQPSDEQPQEVPDAGPDDSELRKMQGLMSKDKEDRLSQLRKKYNK